MFMKRKLVAAAMVCAYLCAVHMGQQTILAAKAEVTADSVIYDGVSIGPVQVGGMTVEQARTAVEEYVQGIFDTKITLQLENVDEKKNETTVTAGDMGFFWANPEVIEEVAQLGGSGNIICRYKAKKDVENSDTNFEIQFSINEEKLQQLLKTNSAILTVDAINATIKKEGGKFVCIDEVDGKTVDLEKAQQKLLDFLANEWDYKETKISLETQVLKAAVTREICEKVGSEPIGSYTTSFTSSGSARCANIENAVKLMTGTVLMPGEQFSCLKYMVPFTAANGYYMAGSYVGGKTVDSYGGGVCQVSTTLYNAVLLAELEVIERDNHGLTVSYVPLAADAAIAESSNMDLIFENNTDAPVYIEGYVYNKTLTFNIYGHETRPANRTIKYVSEVLEELAPGADVITYDASLPAGTQVVTSSSRRGYRAELYKYVYIDGVQQSVERVNYSYYSSAPNYISRGPEVSAVVEEPSIEETLGIVEAESTAENLEELNTVALLSEENGDVVFDEQPVSEPEPEPESESSAELVSDVIQEVITES